MCTQASRVFCTGFSHTSQITINIPCPSAREEKKAYIQYLKLLPFNKTFLVPPRCLFFFFVQNSKTGQKNRKITVPIVRLVKLIWITSSKHCRDVDRWWGSFGIIAFSTLSPLKIVGNVAKNSRALWMRALLGLSPKIIAPGRKPDVIYTCTSVFVLFWP